MSIKAVDLNYVYGNGTAFEQHALFDVNFEIQDGEFVGIIGHTGSGKSTLIQHLNGLIKASSGALYYNGENIYKDKYDNKDRRACRQPAQPMVVNDFQQMRFFNAFHRLTAFIMVD